MAAATISGTAPVLAGPPADAEEGGLGPGGIEQVEHLRRHRIGSVVDGDRHFAMGDGGRRQAGQIGAEQGRARQQAGGGDQRMVGDQRAERPRPEGRFDQAADGGAGVDGQRRGWRDRFPAGGMVRR